jgi:hypothetical protein
MTAMPASPSAVVPAAIRCRSIAVKMGNTRDSAWKGACNNPRLLITIPVLDSGFAVGLCRSEDPNSLFAVGMHD